MKKYSLLLFLLSILFFFSCNENSTEENAPKENGFTTKVELSYSDFLYQLNNYQLNRNYENIILLAEKNHLESKKDFWKCLEEELNKDSTGMLLIHQLNHGTIKKTEASSNKQVIEQLREEFNHSMDRSMVVVEARIKKFGGTHIETKKTGANQFEIIAYNIKDKNRFANLIQQNARFGFFETMENTTALNEILRMTKLIYERDSIAGTPFAESYLDGKPNSFIPRGFMFNVYQENGQYSMPKGAQVGMSKWSDTTFFNQFIRDTIVTSNLPKLVHFLWGMKEDENGLPLYTIKSNNLNRPDLGGEEIVDAKVKKENGSVQVEINFSSEGAEKFRKMTQKNINNAIAIVMDGKVLSAPLVQQEISGGMAVISGNFNLQEAEDLASILKAGTLPVRLKVVEIKEIK
jgi:SecD/SecF fusion protein